MDEGRGRQAAGRARSAMARGAEISDRLALMRGGAGSNQASVDGASTAALIAVDRASQALERAAEAHYASATLHRRIADLLTTQGHGERAVEHRWLADQEDVAGDVDEGRRPRPAA